MSKKKLCTLALVSLALSAGTPAALHAHGVSIGQKSTGQLTAYVSTAQPVELPPSPFPGILGWASAEPGIASAETDLPEEDCLQLAPNSFVQFELVATDPGVQIVTSHVLAIGEIVDFGSPFFDFHFVFNIPSGTFGSTYAIQFRLHDLNGVHPDSDLISIQFTPVANECECRGDADLDEERTGLDVSSFVSCWLSSPSGGPLDPGCACADIDGNGVLDDSDMTGFVDKLLFHQHCHE
jgi:hypothetical protein